MQGGAGKTASFPPELLRKYKILELLGKGGGGEVFLAIQRGLGRKVAIKILRSSLIHDEKEKERFLREGRIMAQLEHPYIVRVYDMGISSARPYTVMEYMQGGTLRSLLDEKGSLPVEDAVRLGMALAEALDVAHSSNVLHRDVKPANIFVTPGLEGIKLADFGLAKEIEGASPSISRSDGVIVGTPLYIAPEQIREEKPSAASDLYSLGVVLYEILAGRPPFTADKVMDLLTAHLNDTPPPLRDFRGDVPASLEKIIERLLAKRPEDRFSSAGELLEALRKVHYIIVHGESEEGDVIASSSIALPVGGAPGEGGDGRREGRAGEKTGDVGETIRIDAGEVRSGTAGRSRSAGEARSSRSRGGPRLSRVESGGGGTIASQTFSRQRDPGRWLLLVPVLAVLLVVLQWRSGTGGGKHRVDSASSASDDEQRFSLLKGWARELVTTRRLCGKGLFICEQWLEVVKGLDRSPDRLAALQSLIQESEFDVTLEGGNVHPYYAVVLRYGLWGLPEEFSFMIGKGGVWVALDYLRMLRASLGRLGDSRPASGKRSFFGAMDRAYDGRRWWKECLSEDERAISAGFIEKSEVERLESTMERVLAGFFDWLASGGARTLAREGMKEELKKASVAADHVFADPAYSSSLRASALSARLALLVETGGRLEKRTFMEELLFAMEKGKLPPRLRRAAEAVLETSGAALLFMGAQPEE